LPRIKDVTGSLAVNPDTVLKAYRELEHQGVAAGRPGLGTFIVSAPETAGLKELASLRRDLKTWLRAAKAAGLDKKAATALAASVLQEFDAVGGPASPSEHGTGSGASAGTGEGVA
jgi:GntR family transcriptional regulator